MLAAIAAIAVSCGGGDEDAFPTAVPTPSAPPPAAERVTFETSDGATIAGSLWAAETPSIVVFAHMRGSNRSAWNPAVERVLDAGFAALAFDFRGHGESAGGDTDLGKIDLDLEAAVEYARQRGYARVFVVGASMGGTAALAVAARQELAGVVVMSSPEGFEGIDARAALASVREPILFIAANGDQPYRRAVEAMHQAVLGTKRLVLLPGNEHGTALLEDERTRAQALDAIISFIGAP
jgi:alpha-beta hydrolase superfamily lysophospholipase